MKLSPEHIEALKPHERLLMKAAAKHYLTRDDRWQSTVIKPLYEAISGTKVRASRCGSCGGGIEWLTRLGIWYQSSINQ